jgi:D-glycero-alpha-D-manno-heptose-7-phosphate kinase
MVITQTPLRISLAGGGTDLAEFYKDGAGGVISCTIDKYIFVIIKERFDERIVLNYSRNETVDRVEDVKHELIRNAMIAAGIEKGVEISTLADIPSEGSGLGSSSSLTVGLLNAFYIFQGEQVTAERLAEEACHIEIELCGKPIGKQDQYIAAYGAMRRLTFHPDGRVEARKVAISDTSFRRFGQNIMLFYTRRTRKSSEILDEQRRNTKSRRALLEAMLPIIDRIERALLNGSFDEVGLALHEGWMLKRQMAEKIADKEIDGIYHRARQAGALGGKIAGAGGGGFMLLYVPFEKQDAVRAALSDLYELPFLLERDGSKVVFNLKRYPFK